MPERADEDWIGDVLSFWFDDVGREAWFRKDAGIDEQIRARFLILYEVLAKWPPSDALASPNRALATVLVLDQFPRNLFRGSAQAFATDALAREVASGAIAKGFDAGLDKDRRLFLYLPFEHSEDKADQVAFSRADLQPRRCRPRRLGRPPQGGGRPLRPLSPPQRRAGAGIDPRGGGFPAGARKLVLTQVGRWLDGTDRKPKVRLRGGERDRHDPQHHRELGLARAHAALDRRRAGDRPLRLRAVDDGGATARGTSFLHRHPRLDRDHAARA